MVKILRLQCVVFVLMIISTVSAQVEVSSGRVERIESFNSNFVTNRNVDIWLPDTYDGNTPHAVLYMHDGQMLFDSATTWNGQAWDVDDVLGRLIDEGKVRKTIVVGIWNGGDTRHPDYFPEKPFRALPEAYQDHLINKAKRGADTPLFSIDVRSDAYLEFITTELKPYIDSQYLTLTDMSNTFVAGSSMGGLISMYSICEYPEVFGGAACLSTHWIGDFNFMDQTIANSFVSYISENLPNPGTHLLYFDYGTETLDAMYERHQKKVDVEMQNAGYSPDNWVTRKFEGEAHTEDAWKKRLHIPLLFLLKEP